MRRSGNEILTAVAKASFAAGYPAGLAEDIAAAATVLLAHGFDGIAAVLASLRQGLPPPPLQADGKIIFTPANAAASGMAAAEMLYAAHTAGKPCQICFERLDSPLLLAGLVGLAASRYHFCYVCQFNDKEEVCIPAAGNLLPHKLPAGITAKLRAGGEWKKDFVLPKPIGAEVAEDSWRQLQQLAAQTYVTASQASRTQGAGAGEIDND